MKRIEVKKDVKDGIQKLKIELDLKTESEVIAYLLAEVEK